MNNTVTLESAIKTIARFWSVLSMLLILLFTFGDGLDPSKLTLREWIGFASFPLGLLLGLLISWRKEVPGAIVAIVSVVVFLTIMKFSWFIVTLAIPALLFIAHNRIIKNNIK